jgi:hypothetical protein
MEAVYIPIAIFLVGIVLLAAASSRPFHRANRLDAPRVWADGHNYIIGDTGNDTVYRRPRAELYMALFMPILVSLVLAAGVYVILSNHYTEEKNGATAPSGQWSVIG